MFWCMVFIDSKYYISIIMCIYIEDRYVTANRTLITYHFGCSFNKRKKENIENMHYIYFYTPCNLISM